MIFLAPLVLAWTGGVALLLADGRRPWVGRASALLLGGVGVLDLVLLWQVARGTAVPFEVVSGGWPQGAGIRQYVDALGLFFGAVCAAVLSLVTLHECRGGTGASRLPAFLVLLAAALHGAFFTGDLFNFYVFFELAIVASFALAMHGYGRAETRGSFIYMAVNMLGSLLFLAGVAVVYHVTGTLDLELLAASPVADGGRGLALPGALLLTAFSLKLGLFPFHGWVPVIYSHARPAVAAALAGALVNLGAYGLLRVGYTVFPSARADAALLLVLLGAGATVYGGLLALRRRSAAELAAYTAIGHAGYIMLAFGLGGPLGVAAVLTAVATGAIDKTAMFLSLDAPRRLRETTALAAAVSVAGLPLSAGFVLKVQLLHASLAGAGGGLAAAALLAAAPLTMAAAFRYRRLAVSAGTRPAGRAHLALASLPVLTLAIGVAPDPLARLTTAIAAGVTGGTSP